MTKLKNYQMLCGFGGEPTIITLNSKQPREFYCLKCSKHIITIKEAKLDINCDFYFICYECQEKNKDFFARNRQMIEHLKEYKLEKDGRLLTDGELNRLIEIMKNRNIFGEKQVIN